MSTLTLYSKPNCPQCVQTKRKLEQKGLAFNTIDISLDAASAKIVTDLGYRQVPVVVSATQHWSGFRPDLLNALC